MFIRELYYKTPFYYDQKPQFKNRSNVKKNLL